MPSNMEVDELRSLILKQQACRDDEPWVLTHVATRTTTPCDKVYGPLFALVAQGSKRLVVGDELVSVREGELMVVPETTAAHACHIDRASEDMPFLGVGFVLRPEPIANLLLDNADVVRGRASGIEATRAPAELIDALVRLLRLHGRPRDRAVLGPLLEREILWRLLTGEQGARLRQIALADRRLAQVGAVLHWIRANYAQPLHIDELARLAGMSVSSFHRHFRAATKMTPLQYQKRVRLQEARVRLMADPDDVAGAGFSVGYASPSHFSREYNRAFGAPPGRDATRIRVSSVSPG